MFITSRGLAVTNLGLWQHKKDDYSTKERN